MKDIKLMDLEIFNILVKCLFLFLSGLYLYMLVVETFSGDNLRFSMYAFIGWGALIFLLKPNLSSITIK